ncbi:MAG: hypothetical protein BZY87_04195 [SAR202 cluster bacterium Io17-Chloro-G6]|nr:MAG: hypothetical protein BZY87_04195 [SAR202 cluster bacterium Io17-Chloro-G6]
MDAGTALAIFFGTVLALFSIFVVGYSLVRGNRSEPDAHENTLPESDEPALGDIFDAIRTLELEHQLGRMPQEEFEEQFQTYRVQAATVLRDQLEAGRGDPAWVLEHQILLARDAQESASGRAIACPDCSAAVPESAVNCPHCGAEMVSQP